jgi:hypothetical protein
MQQQINIPKPCHENWDAMQPRQEGKFCGSCCKTVVDFTNWETQDIFAYLKQNTGTCGKFKKSQLQPVQVEEDVVLHIVHSNVSLWRKMVAVVVVVFLLGTTSCTENNVGKALNTTNNIKDSLLTAVDSTLQTDTVNTITETEMGGLLGEPVAVATRTLGTPQVIDVPPPVEHGIVGEIAIVEPPVDADTTKRVKPKVAPFKCGNEEPRLMGDTILTTSNHGAASDDIMGKVKPPAPKVK